MAQFAVQWLLGNPLNGTFVDHPVVNQVGDGADLDVVFGGKSFQFGATGHGAVVVHHFADHAARLETGHARQVARRFGVAGTGQGTAGLGHQREDVARADDVFSLGITGGGSLHGARTVGGGNAGGHAGGRFDRYSELGAETGTVARCHQRQLEQFAALAAHRHADQATGVLGHEVDVLGLAALGGHDQVAFVLAVFVIHEDDHLALADVFNQFFDAIERHKAPP
ncbi:hypothetical protein D3C87_1044600 [compost metagenome]